MTEGHEEACLRLELLICVGMVVAGLFGLVLAAILAILPRYITGPVGDEPLKGALAVAPLGVGGLAAMALGVVGGIRRLRRLRDARESSGKHR